MFRRLLIIPIILLLLSSSVFALVCPEGCECLSFSEFEDKYDKDPSIGDLCSGEYEPCGTDPMTDLPRYCFTIPEEHIGTGEAEEGPSSPPDHVWEYDPNSTDIWNEMLQLEITAGSQEDIKLTSIQLKAYGSGDDAKEITRIELYEDMFGDGIVDSFDQRLAYAEPAYSADDGTTRINPGWEISGSSTRYLLIAYVMSPGAKNGSTFGFTAEQLKAKGVDTGVTFYVSGFPKSSAIKTVIVTPKPGARCEGSLSLSLDSATAAPGESITATATGFSNCTNRTVTLQNASCDSSNPSPLCSCTAGLSGCSCSFSAPTEAGTYTMYACLDMDGDGDADPGEEATAPLIVEEECISDAGCADWESCTDNECTALADICGYASNHSWSTYGCGNETGCPACPGSEVCENNSCVQYFLEAPLDATLGDDIILKLLKDNETVEEAVLAVTDPGGNVSPVTTNSSGEATFTALYEGKYIIAMSMGKETIISKELNVGRGETVADLLSKLFYLVKENPLISLIILILILLGLVKAVYWHYSRERKEEEMRGEEDEEEIVEE